MIVLGAEDCRAILDPGAVLAAVEDALRMEHAGTVRWSAPPALRIPGRQGAGRLRVGACTLEEPGVVGVRVLLFPAGGEGTRWVLVFHERTGEPIAVVDERWTYAQRSIASVALVAHRLRPKEVGTVAILGAGRIGQAALPYVARLFPDAEVAIASQRPGTRAALAETARAEHGIAAAADTVEAAVRRSRVVFACSSAREPIVREAWVAPGAVVASLEPRECEPALFRGVDLRVVDRLGPIGEELDAAFDAGAVGLVDTTMAEVVGGAHPGRTSAAQRILVLSHGLVSQDVLLAWRAAVVAGERGLGVIVDAPGAAAPL